MCISYVGGYLGSGLEPLRGARFIDGHADGSAAGDIFPASGPGRLTWLVSLRPTSRWPMSAAPGDGARAQPRPRPRWAHLPTQPLARHLSLALLGAIALYFITSALSPYNNVLVGQIALYLIALAGLSLLTGMSGQISLGQGAFMAVGAYTVALLMAHTHMNFVLELLAAIGAAAALGLVIGISATRLKGALAGLTLLLALALPPIADKWSTTFGGGRGLTTTVPTSPGTINPEEWLAWIELGGALITLVLLANLLSSRFGRAFRSVRDDEVAASLSGVHVARTKVVAFVVTRPVPGWPAPSSAYRPAW